MLNNNLNSLFTKLGLSEKNGLYLIKEDIWKNEVAFPNRVKRLITKKIKPDAFFCFDNKPIILFFDNPSNKEKLLETIWNFNESPIAIIIENSLVEIYNGFKIGKDKKGLELLGGIDKLNDFSYFELVTGRTWEKYKDNLYYKNRVDYNLLENIKEIRHILVNKDVGRAKLINALLGKVIFARYLIDRKVKINFDGKLRTWSNQDFCDLLDIPNQVQNFFEYLEDKEKGFNGDLFPISSAEYKQIKAEDYSLIKGLLLGEDIKHNQPSLFELYDFSIIPIEFISNIYELFIGQENQKKEGAYYTPLFLVDYILKETVEKHLSDSDKLNTLNNIDSFSYCKVFDPACGSGIFLVETLRKIIEKYIEDTNIDSNSNKFKTAIKNLAKENLFGIDKDLSAVQVAIFSIYLTLLDYLEPPDIESFKFPVLLNTNFFQTDFFDVSESAVYNDKFKGIKFDFILGNPPWKGNGMDPVGISYLKKRKAEEKELKRKFNIAINNNEVAEGFILRASDFCKPKTQIAFIIRSSSLYNLGYNKNDVSPFRQYLLEEYYIDKVFELAPVRHEVFEKSNAPAIAPAAIIFYRYANGENTDKNIIHHISLKQSRFFSLFKIFTINRPDYKEVQQNKLKEFDWLWKILVYGSYLDFNFIKRLKEQFLSIKQVINNKSDFIYATGFHSSSKSLENPKDVTDIENIPFVKTTSIKSFFLNYQDTDNLEKDKIDIVKNTIIYKNPMLLIRKGLDMDLLTAKCSISNQDILFKDGITSIKPLNNNIDNLYNIASIFSSSLFSYYAINTFASIGIEREQTQNYNKFSLPYLDIDIKDNIKKIERIKLEIYSEDTKDFKDEAKIQDLKNSVSFEFNRINHIIFQKLNLNEIESTLIDYALQINLKLIIGNDIDKKDLFSTLNFKDEILINYASLYIRRFQSSLSSIDSKFIVEIWHTNQIIGMFFKIVPIQEYQSDIVWINKQKDDFEILSDLIKLSSEKITEQLFIQKDIRGFKKDYFYIFKPNEKRLWHKAIGYLDVDEFADAILSVGSK